MNIFWRNRRPSGRGALAAASFALCAALPASAGDGLGRSIGKALFDRAWVPAPSSTLANDGLGPLFNARACVACHQGLERMPVRADRNGRVLGDNLVLRLSDPEGGPDPTYGLQIQTAAVPGLEPDGAVSLGEAGPHPTGLTQGPLAARTRFGARLAPALRGVGALDAVPDDAILALADPDDANRDGISGRANFVAMPDGSRRVGRFGWKASAPHLSAMVESAFFTDLGLSTPGWTDPAGDCGARRRDCREAPHGGTPEAPEMTGEIVGMITAYLAGVAPPQPIRQEPPTLFVETGCAACHRPSLPSPAGEVRAYTDVLLHDLGPDLDGGATAPGVASTEWRTAPLWGLSRILASGAGLLHDGRARTIDEAVRAHGGEASRAKVRYLALGPEERRRLRAFLSSL